jgi:hypothetical protein
MHNRRSQNHPHEPMLGTAFDDWIDEHLIRGDDDKMLALIHFMAGAGAACGLIREAHGSGRSDAASQVFNTLMLEIKAFSMAAQKTAEAMSKTAEAMSKTAEAMSDEENQH